ncbi:MAG: shikimate kinase [Oscillospiraceae bacterium]|nr:shikimate kinase [Oscillospiraceae bacterium]
MKNIVLFGFMGCGKSTVGQLLAEQTGRTLLDTDSFLEQKYGRRIADIFAEDGEDAFRAMETAVCRELSDRRGLILCCGGGTVLREENAAILSQGGTMVFLDIPFAAAYARICGSDRPLVRNNSKETLEQIFLSRAPVYRSRAQLTVDASQSPKQVADAIRNRIK